jgi:hypothetical protein
MSFTQVSLLATQVLIYLRKSRQDDPKETVEEVLAKHETDLQEYAMREFGCRIPEENIYREVASAESIDGREEIKRVLTRIEDPVIKAVLVVDPQRLTRGDLGDCDRLIKAFHLSKTRVITLRMDYDLDNKMERKFFQDELLRGRDYYEYTREILFFGRVRAVKRGCFGGQWAPYGYEKVKKGKDTTLEIIDDQAAVVQMIFQWYADDELSPNDIARRLNEMSIPGPRGNAWVKESVRGMLDNMHYIGKVTFNEYKQTSLLENGEIVVKSKKQPAEEVIIAEGKHQPIISMDVWDRVHSRIANNPRMNIEHGLRNPLAGLLRCSKCGKVMQIHPYQPLKSNRYECRSRPFCFKSAPEEEVNDALLYALENVELPALEARLNGDEGDARKIQQKLLEKLEKEMQELRDREEEQYDLLESRVYDRQTFERRNAKLREQMEECQNAIYRTRATLPKNVDYGERIVALKTAISALRDPEMPIEGKNRLLKAIIKSIEYTSVPPSKFKRGQNTQFPITLEIFLRL